MDLIISTIVFFMAASYLRRYLDGEGLAKGMTRGHAGIYTRLLGVMGFRRDGRFYARKNSGSTTDSANLGRSVATAESDRTDATATAKLKKPSHCGGLLNDEPPKPCRNQVVGQ